MKLGRRVNATLNLERKIAVKRYILIGCVLVVFGATVLLLANNQYDDASLAIDELNNMSLAEISLQQGKVEDARRILVHTLRRKLVLSVEGWSLSAFFLRTFHKRELTALFKQVEVSRFVIYDESYFGNLVKDGVPKNIVDDYKASDIEFKKRFEILRKEFDN